MTQPKPATGEAYEEFDRDISRLLTQLDKRKNKFLYSTERMGELHGPMYRYLLVLDKNPGASQDFLAEQLLLDKGNNARLARKLEDAGYICRTPLPENRRQYEITLTEKGQATVPIVYARLKEWSAALVKGFTRAEEQQLVTLLNRMLQNAEGLE